MTESRALSTYGIISPQRRERGGWGWCDTHFEHIHLCPLVDEVEHVRTSDISRHMVHLYSGDPLDWTRKESGSNAAFVRRMGWGTGAILDGVRRVLRDGRHCEGPQVVRITAIGESSVLGRRVYEETNSESHEHSYTFDMREWRIRP